MERSRHLRFGDILERQKDFWRDRWQTGKTETFWRQYRSESGAVKWEQWSESGAVRAEQWSERREQREQREQRSVSINLIRIKLSRKSIKLPPVIAQLVERSTVDRLVGCSIHSHRRSHLRGEIFYLSRRSTFGVVVTFLPSKEKPRFQLPEGAKI